MEEENDDAEMERQLDPNHTTAVFMNKLEALAAQLDRLNMNRVREEEAEVFNRERPQQGKNE